MRKPSPMTQEMTPRSAAEGQSLDFVQRVLVSLLVFVVVGTFSAVLAVYLVIRGDADLPRSSVVGLWVMTGVIGLVAAGVIMLVNGRKLYHPAMLLGLLPMAASCYWIFT